MQLYEKWRPRVLEDVCGQDKAVAIARRLIQSGMGGRALWVSGLSGVGKSSICFVIARTMAHECCIVETTGRELSPSKVRQLADDMRQYGIYPGGRVVVCNESQGLSGPAIEVLLDALESIPSHAAWLFTTSKIGQDALFADHDDAGPLLSRCTILAMTNQGIAEAFAANVRRIAEAEGLDGGKDDAWFLRLARAHKSNHRAMLQAVEAGACLS